MILCLYAMFLKVISYFYFCLAENSLAKAKQRKNENNDNIKVCENINMEGGNLKERRHRERIGKREKLFLI